jgi:hypothetical protein
MPELRTGLFVDEPHPEERRDSDASRRMDASKALAEQLGSPQDCTPTVVSCFWPVLTERAWRHFAFEHARVA